MTDRSISVRLGLNAADFNAGIRSASSSLEDLAKTGDKTGRTASTGLGRLEQSARLQGQEWQTVGTQMLKVGAATTAIGTAVAVTGGNYNRLQQTSRAALSSMLGGAVAANQQMDRLDEWATNSPFSRAVWIEVQQQMLAFGIESDKVIGYMSGIQDAVAAAGGSEASLRGISEIMAKISSSAKITAADLNQFGNWGVDAADLIGRAMGKTGAEIRTSITEGTLDAGIALDALAAGMTDKFGGAAAAVKDTFDGALDRVKAAFRDVSAQIMQPFIGVHGGGLFTDLLNQVADLLRAFEKLPGPVKDFAAGLGIATAAMGLLGGSFMLSLPKLLEMQRALVGLSTAGLPVISKIAGSMASAGPKFAESAALASGSLAQFRDGMVLASQTGVSKLQGLKISGGAALKGLAGSAKTAGSAVVGALGGWPTIAAAAGIAAVVTAVSHFQRKAQEARQAAKELAGAMTDLSGTEVKQWAFDQIVDRGALDALKAAGVDIAALVSAVSGGDISQLDAFADAIGRLSGNALSLDEYGKATETIKFFRSAMEDASEIASAQADALGDAADGADGFADALDGTTESAMSAADALTALLDAQLGLASASMSQIEAERRYAETLRDSSTAVDDIIAKLASKYEAMGQGSEEAKASAQAEWDAAVQTGEAWQHTTEVGALVSESLLTQARDGQTLIKAMQDNNATSEELSAAQSMLADDFIATATAMGVPKQQAMELAREYGLIPKKVVTVVTAEDKASGVVSEIQTRINSLTGKTVNVHVRYLQSGNIHEYTPGFGGGTQVRATGGAVFGPGTTTSDSIPVWMSNSEHVWSAAEVAAAGGHGAMEAMRAMARVGKFKPFALASGGQPAMNVSVPRSFAVTVPTSSSMSFPSSLEISGRLEFEESGLVRIIDGRVVKYV